MSRRGPPRETACVVRPHAVMGPDVAVDQGPVDWHRVRSAGARFAFARATAGAGARDLRFTPARWAAMRDAGLARGAYHEARPAGDPADEARAFCAAVRLAGGLQPGDLPPALAVRDSGLSAAETLAWIGAAVAELESVAAVTPLLLTSPEFWIDRLGDPRVSFGCALWIADHEAVRPRIPRAWPDWALWQYTPDGRLPGVLDTCGLSRLNGGRRELERLTRLRAAQAR
jgi:lysozyme